MKKLILLSIVFFGLNNWADAQTAPFGVYMDSFSVEELGGLQSYAFGQSEEKWLILGGRLDGLHRRQPFAAFDIAGHNNQIIVVDPLTEEKWSAPLTTLPQAIQEQLSSTNMEFYQDGDFLYCIGGYGYSETFGDHTTFDNLTAIEVPLVINAIINGEEISGFFRQISHPNFQVTGGRLNKINGTFYLSGGQKFIGRYNPVGPNHGPGFIQEYTDAIRIFTIEDDGANMTIEHLPPLIDADNLHRRDYNAEPQILADGSQGITMFSGVFNPNNDLPFLSAVTIDFQGYEVEPEFQQFYNHYHCPAFSIYSEAENEMHTVFFGGIAQYYDNDGTLMQDDNVPFVNTIARVTRTEDGDMAEYKLPIEMPALLGAGAEFIPNLNFPHFENEVFILDSLDSDTVLVGYIYGGISSSQPNIFFINNGSQSTATNQIFRVYLYKDSALSADQLNTASLGSLNLLLYPNPNNGVLNIEFNLTKREDVEIRILTPDGKLIERSELKSLNAGKHTYTKRITGLSAGSVYLISVETPSNRAIQKLKLAQ